MNKRRREIKTIQLVLSDEAHTEFHEDDQVIWEEMWDEHDRQRSIKEEELSRKQKDVDRLVATIKSREEYNSKSCFSHNTNV